MTISIRTFDEVRDASWRIAKEHLNDEFTPLKDVRKLAQKIQDAIESELADA